MGQEEVSPLGIARNIVSPLVDTLETFLPRFIIFDPLVKKVNVIFRKCSWHRRSNESWNILISKALNCWGEFKRVMCRLQFLVRFYCVLSMAFRNNEWMDCHWRTITCIGKRANSFVKTQLNLKKDKLKQNQYTCMYTKSLNTTH